jgi:DNA repair protein RadC
MVERNGFKALSDELKPREKMRRASSVRAVDDESLLAVMLKTGANGCDVVELSRRLLKAFGSLSRLVRCDWRELGETIRQYNKAHPNERVLGIGPTKQLELAAAFELVRRGFEVLPEDVRAKTVDSTEAAVEIFRRSLAMGEEQENLFVLPLDAKKHPLCEPICATRGTLDMSPVHSREVFKDAIRWGAHAVIVAHNHPSGDPTPSREDVIVTKRLLEASLVVGIPLLDHIVIGNPGFASLRALGLVAF